MRRRFFSNRFDYMILYTSTDGNIVHPRTVVGFNQNIKSNTYTNIGKITFRGPFSIGSGVFYNCDTLKTIIIPNSITTIENSAFSYCYNLTSVTIPDSVTEISSSAFIEDISLTSIEIPNSVTSIGEGAFYGCTGLTSVYIKSTTPPILGGYVFDSNASGRKIYVPRASLDAYKTAEGWSKYADAIEPYDF